MKKIKRICGILLSALMLVSFIVPQSMVLADDGSAYELSMEQTAPEMPEEETAPEAQAETQTAAPEEASLPVQAEEETEKENAPPAEVEASVYPAATEEAKAILGSLDFSAKRLIIGTSDESVFLSRDEIVASYGNVYLLQFSDEETAKNAYAYYAYKVDFVEVDTAVGIADGETEGATETIMTAEENPFTELENTLPMVEGPYEVALIDTGVQEGSGVDAVSVLGENAADDNGHGSRMAQIILGRDAETKILSVKALNGAGEGTISSIYAAIHLAMEKGVKIINLSVSAIASADSRIVEDAIREAAMQGIVVVGAAGNNASDASYFIPGRINEALIVGSCDADGVKNASSNFGATVDYNVIASSTSEAAANMTAVLVNTSVEELESIADQGFIFRPNYDPAEAQSSKAPSGDGLFHISAGEGGSNYLDDALGISRQTLINSLLQKEASHDFSYYLGTPYGVSWAENDSFYPNGSPRWDGYRGMNCTGFVAVAINDAGGNLDAVRAYCDYAGEDAPWGIAGASVWSKFLLGSNIKYRVYDTKEELLNDKWAEKGDIIYCNPTLGGDTHIGLYWGDYAGHDQMWHSYYYMDGTDGNRYGNLVGPVDSKSQSQYFVFKWKSNGWLQVYKFSTNTNITDGNSNYAIRGAKFTVYNANGEVAGTLIAGNDGYTNKIALPEGDYLIKETQAPESGYTIEPEWAAGKWVTVTNGHTEDAPLVQWIGDTPITPSLKLKKESAKPQITDGNSNYSLAGAVYTVYKDASCTQAVSTMTTNASGDTSAITLPLGKYYVKETTAARNYKLDTTVHTVTLTASHTSSNPYVLRVTDAPKTGWMQAHKTSKDTSVTNGNSNYSLRGAQFTVYNSANTAVGTLTVADNGYTNKIEVALGTYTVKETRAPESGYTIDAEWAAGKQFTVTADHTETSPLVANAADTPIVPVFKLKKSSSNPQLTNNNPIYSLAGAVYTVYKDASCTQIVKTMTTDANGDTAAVSLPLGTYYVKETSPAHNYKLDTERYTVTLTTSHTSSNPYVLRVTDIPKNGWLQIYKYSKDTSVSDGNNNYALRGAKFTIYNSENAVAGTLIVAENGYTDKIELLPGEYLIKETGKPERGYKIDPEWAAGKRFTVTAENTEAKPLVVSVGDTPITPSVKVKKTSANPQISDDNACYSLAGAVYTIYKNAACTQTAATLTTDSQGNTQTVQLPLGTYFIKETKAAKNYMLDPAVYPVTLKEEHTETNPYVLSVTDVPGNDPGAIELTKESNVDYATMFPLEGARFEIKYYDNTAGNVSGTPKRTWVLQTKKYSDGTYKAQLDDPECLVEGSDALYMDGNRVVIPVGTISVEEIKPAQGYTLTDATLKDGDGNEIELEDGKYISTITMQNGMAKLNYGNYYTMLNTPVEIHTAAANIADGSHYAKVDKPVTIVDTITMAGTDAERLINADGEWDYIHYRLKGELRVVGTNEKIADMTDPVTGRPYRNFVTDDFDGNKEFMQCVIEDPEVLASLEGKTLYIAENLYTVITKNVDGQRQEIETLVATEDESRFPDKMSVDIKESQRIHFPMIGTTLEEEGITYKNVKKDITLTDTVTYRSLIQGHTYKVTGVLMDKETGKEILDDNGRKITAEKEFTAKDIDGAVEVAFTFPAVLLHGKTVVAFETCYENNKELCVHKDLSDEDQTVTFMPSEIATMLTERESGEHEAFVLKNMTLVDTVSFSGLATDAEYTLKGVLMDKATGKPILDDNGKEVRAEKKFTPPTESGVIEMEFTFPAVLLHGKTVVAFEELSYNNKPITEHKDLNDEGQTVTFMPSEIATMLTERESGEHEALVMEELTLVDTVSFSGLATDAEYTLKGVLMDKATGKPILDDNGKEVRAEKKFTPPTESGVIEMEFTFPAVLMHGKTLVAFEELLYETQPVTEHKDLADEGQTLDIIPTKIGTTFYNPAAEEAEDEESLHSVNVGKKIKLIDTVAYTGASVGTEYTVTGTIMDKETGKELLNPKGKPYTKEVTFTPTKPDGTVKLTFTIDAKAVYDGKTLVAFEEMKFRNKLIAEHKDLEDKGQTVKVIPPELHTTLIDDETHTHVANAFRTLSLTDTVEYKGLVKGTEYELKGTLMNKETGKPAVNSKGKPITATSKFKAEASEGTAEVTFEFKNRELMGGTLVAFEQLYEADTQIADHEDLEDEEQSVRLPYIGTTLTLNDTSKRFYPTEELQLNDAVALNNLDLQTTYIVRGYLVDQTSGRYLKADGTGTKDKSEAMVKEVKFHATKHDARLNVEFALNASGIDFDIVCFEELYAVGIDEDGNETITLVAEHADIEDEAQTVHYEPTPKTGDKTNALLWIVLEIAALSGIALAGTIAVKKMHR